MNILTTIPNLIRTRWTPAVSRFYTALRLANRPNLTANVKALSPTDEKVERQMIENLALAGILKYRFHQTAEFSKLGEHMFSGRVTPKQITAFASTLAGDHASVDEIRDALLVGVYQSTNPLMPKIVNASVRTAFALGAVGAAATGMTLYGIGFTSLVSVTIGLAVAAKGVQKLAWFNPETTIGKLVSRGSRLFYPVVFATVLFGALTAYQFIRNNFYPRYHNEKQITVTCHETEVKAEVCQPNGSNCRESTVWTYTGQEASERCQTSATHLQAEINDDDLFNGQLAVDYDIQHLRLINSWRPSWLPERITWGTSTLLDLSPQSLTVAQRQDALSQFTGNLWMSGIMPSGREVNTWAAHRLERWLVANRFRDPRLQMELDLASRYQALDRYDDAVGTAQQIVDFNLTVTAARPMFYDEALLLQADTRRIQAMRFWSPELLDQSFATLTAGLNNPRLHSLETGYPTRYNYELIRSCVIGEQFFRRETTWTHRVDCTPERVDQYLANATTVNNLYTPIYNDNYLGLRTLLEYGHYQYALRNYAAAADRYHQALAVIDLIDNCTAATEGDADANWSHYSGYMRPLDRWLGENVSREAGLWSYARRCEVGRTLRGDLSPLRRSEQFDPALFAAFRARAQQGLAQIEVRQASLEPERAAQHLQAAEQLQQSALETARSIMRRDPYRFFTSRFEEREIYLEILVDHAETLLKIYQLNIRRNPADLARAAGFAEDVIGLRGEEPIDILYLRALFIQADINLINHRPAAAAQAYRQITERIATATGQLPAGRDLPPHYQFLQILVQNRLAGLP